MNLKHSLLLAGVALLALPWASAQAGPRIGVGVYVGGPGYYPYYSRPYYDGYYYYRPAPIYVAPAPIIVQAAPAPVVVGSSPAPVETVAPPLSLATPVPAVTPASQSDLPAPRTLTVRGDDIEGLMQHLSNPDDKVRADVAIRLGRLKARRAAETLERVLGADRSPEVRDAAARALGLIGMPASIPSLQRAAQSDDDRGVRASAQFAVEVIRTR